MATAIPPSSDGTSASAPRVLVVDDQPVFRQAARLLLERRGYPVVAEASCAVSAVDAVERFAPEGVLLDVRLGDDDGVDVCRTLLGARPGLAVLLTSTVEHDPCDDLVASSGVRGFISKGRLLDTDFEQFWPRVTLTATPCVGSPERRGDSPHSVDFRARATF
jgi:CheY-like chemotaxis protein